MVVFFSTASGFRIPAPDSRLLVSPAGLSQKSISSPLPLSGISLILFS
jgi:hypothetical protein